MHLYVLCLQAFVICLMDLLLENAREPKKKKQHPDYTDVFSSTLIRLASEDPRIVAVTAAMPEGTGLSAFRKRFPKRFFDVGIAEQHAVTSAAGMAAGGLRPVVAVYSSFLQRGFDQILHDVCYMNNHVVFALDRSLLRTAVISDAPSAQVHHRSVRSPGKQLRKHRRSAAPAISL